MRVCIAGGRLVAIGGRDYPVTPPRLAGGRQTYGEVLAVRLSYLPEGLLWLVSSPMQSRLMHAHRPDTLILTLAEAQDLLTALGDPCPGSLMEVAGRFATAAPGPP